MKRRDFFKTLLGAGAAVAVGPQILALAKPAAGINPAWQTATFEASFVIPPQEISDWLVMRTIKFWQEETLKNLTEGVRKIAI